MKYLLIATLLLVAWFVWRAPRTRTRDSATPSSSGTKPPALPQEMVRCPVCSLHLPRNDALPGASGRLYCSHEHRSTGGN